MPSLNHIRRTFLEYFSKQGHQMVPSSPLVPHHDPTLMFTNAGMVPFKDVFTGNETRDYKRATSSQKCVRAGGKHNDLDNVGYTARHHTFFEMLGNFSFGDYFKEEAINFAWELLTKEFDLPKDKLLVTVYHTDDQAFDLWKKLTGFADERIIRIPTKDNFWAMGDTGPCGPCSEIFFDHGDDIAGGPPGSPDEDGDRFIEIWNLVFMQYEQQSADVRVDLPKPSIDTGMGLERMAAVLQNVHDNYDIDLFKSLIEASKDISKNDNPNMHNSHRIIADHLRSCSFLLADGVMPSNEGRGYVLRRIMRRGMRHAHQLGCKEPLMHRLVPALITEMGEAYPELVRAQALITEMLKLEEEKFKQTLDRGLKLLGDESKKLSQGNELPGEVAFKLYDTYGFPLDLTKDILRSEDKSVDESGFDNAMAEQKARARAAWKGSGEAATESVWFDIVEREGATEFLGYESTDAQGNVVAIIKDGAEVESAKQGDTVSILLNQTPFYGESGGQQGDFGALKGEEETAIEVTNTTKVVGSLHVHQGTVQSGSVAKGATLKAQVDISRRDALRANHSATHILHAVLRRHLGHHVTQKGSLVAQDRLRFDISHPKALTAQEIADVEAEVNDIIRQNSRVGTRLMTPDDAIEAGALALFGEKYGDEVRVVNMGLDGTVDYSVELCGGTHVNRTGDIGCFKIIVESAIAAGIRRIEAVTGAEALAYMNKTEQQLSSIAGLLKVSTDQTVERIEAMLAERKKLEKELATAKKEAAMGGGAGASSNEPEMIGDIAVIARHFDDMEPKDLRGLAGDLQQKLPSGVVAVGCTFEGKGSLIVSVSNDLTDRVNAVDLVKGAATILGAKGAGGKPHFAQTGGPIGEKVSVAIDEVKKSLAS